MIGAYWNNQAIITNIILSNLIKYIEHNTVETWTLTHVLKCHHETRTIHLEYPRENELKSE